MTERLYGLIPAAGKGIRAYPYTKMTPKCMIDINGQPNLLRTIGIMRDQLGIHDIFIVIGHYGEVIRRYFKDGKDFGVNLTYIENTELDRGLAYSVLLGQQYINDYFCILLSDEFYLNSNHAELAAFPYRDALATCGIMPIEDRNLIKRNYSVEVEGERITRLIEKPEVVSSNLLGCGTFVFSPRIFPLLEQAFVRAGMKYVDLVSFIGALCASGEKIRYFLLKSTYVNINDRDSLNLVKYNERSAIFDQIAITLLVYSEGDEEDIGFTLSQYRRLECLKHIFVVLPEGSQLEGIVRKNGAVPLVCPAPLRQYGEKLKYAMEQVPGDIFILTEANYSFPSRDIAKLLAYLREADMVIGTRTTRQLIEQGSTMRGIVRFANVWLAKLVELLWWQFEGRFTDVGCTFRAIWRTSFDDIRDQLVARGPEFSVEMMIEVLRARDRIIEVPVNYFTRSQSLYRRYQNVGTFFRLLWCICKKNVLYAVRDSLTGASRSLH